MGTPRTVTVRHSGPLPALTKRALASRPTFQLGAPAAGDFGERLRADLEIAAVGHCLRVDHLIDDDVLALCAIVERSGVGGNGIQASVLDADHGSCPARGGVRSALNGP